MSRTEARHTQAKDQTEKQYRCGCHAKQSGKTNNAAHVMQEQSQRDHSDVLGSYTGTPADGGEPVQDQDDL